MKLIKSEQKLLDILGYQAINLPDSNQWLIVDNENTKVGTIVKEKLNNSDQERYITRIISENVVYQSSKDEDNNYYYKLEVRNIRGNMDTFELSLNKNPFLTVDSNDFGYTIFSIVDKEQFLLDNTSIENKMPEKGKKLDLILNEKILVELNNNSEVPKKFEYQFAATPISSLGNYETIIVEEFSHEENGVIINQQIGRINDMVITNNTFYSPNQIFEESIKKSHLSTGTFQAFRDKLNECYPSFQKDLVEEIAQKITTKEFKLFTDAPTKNTDKKYVMSKLN